MLRLKVYNTFMTLFFDGLEFFISILLTFTYYSQRRDVIKVYSYDETTQYILHPLFEKHQESLCLIALFTLVISTIFIQTIIQGFLLSKIYQFKTYSMYYCLVRSLGL
jgi:hypothetical protein